MELAYSLDGPDDAPVLVLGSSLGATRAMWDAQVPAFSQRFRMLRFDTRGHGRSPVPPGPYTMDDLGSDVLALLDRLGIERFSFCGLSIGGMIGMWCASEAPERIERLVLCCTVPHFPPPELWDERADTVRAHGMEPLVESTLERWLPPDIRSSRPDLEEHLRSMIAATPPEGYAGCCNAVRDMDLRPRLGRISAPTLVVAASDDPSTPKEKVRPIADAVSGARYVEIADAAHIANVAQPEAFDAAVLDFLV
jgi:3-oxoadipate enol-lactonase